MTRGSSSWIVLVTPFTVRVVEKAMLYSVGAVKSEIRCPKKLSDAQSLGEKSPSVISRDDPGSDWSAFA